MKTKIDKSKRKQLEKEIGIMITEKFAKIHKAASLKVSRHVRSSIKQLLKKLASASEKLHLQNKAKIKKNKKAVQKKSANKKKK